MMMRINTVTRLLYSKKHQVQQLGNALTVHGVVAPVSQTGFLINGCTDWSVWETDPIHIN